MEKDVVQGYSSGELANYLGMSPQGLHWYEERGLTNPLRKKDRRIYTTDDLYVLSRIRFYHQAGFSLEETEELLTLDVDEAGKRLGERVDEMRRSLEVERAKIDLFANRAELARNFKSRKGRFEAAPLEPFYYPWSLVLDATKQNQRKRNVAKSWAREIPFAQYLSVVVGSRDTGIERAYAGFALPVRFASFASDEVRADIAQNKMPVFSVGSACYGLVESTGFDEGDIFTELIEQLGLQGKTVSLLRRPISCGRLERRVTAFWEAWLTEEDLGL